jgi:hypothetical protein
MNRSRTIQEWIHWLEAGAGAQRVRLAAVLLCTLALSLLIAWKQFQGPGTEATLRQADLGRQIARGAGFTTLVNYPQVHAVLEPSGHGFDDSRPLPELYEAPLYPLLIAAGLRVFPESLREKLFAQAPQPPDGFAADYFLLGLNLLLFWLAAWQTYDLGRRLFEPRVGWLAAFGLLLSVPIWQQVVAVNGLPLMMVLVLAMFRFCGRSSKLLKPEPRLHGLLWWDLGQVVDCSGSPNTRPEHCWSWCWAIWFGGPGPKSNGPCWRQSWACLFW